MGIWFHYFMANREKVETVETLYFGGSKITADSDCSHEIKRHLTPWKESHDQRRQHIKKQRHYFANKGLSSQGYGFSSSHVWMWELEYKESWVPKSWCFWTVVLARTLESSMDCKEIQSVHPKGNQPWIFIGMTGAEAEVPILWPPDAKSWLIRKDPDAGKDWRWEEKGTAEDNMVGWHHWFNGHEFEQTPEDCEGQGSLACCSLWGRKESDMTEWLNNNNNDSSIFKLEGNLQAAFHNGGTNFHSHQQCTRVPISAHPCRHLLSFDNRHSNGCEVIFHCESDLHFQTVFQSDYLIVHAWGFLLLCTLASIFNVIHFVLF